MNCLYSLKINPLSVASFANIFSHSVGCLFILFMVSFAVQKLLSLIRSHLFIFAFVSITVGDRSKKILLRFTSKSVLPMFSSRSFIVSGLTFRSFHLFISYSLPVGALNKGVMYEQSNIGLSGGAEASSRQAREVGRAHV